MRNRLSTVRRLTTGVSLAALCIAAPSLAQMTTVTTPGAQLPEEYSVGVTETYVFGVTATGTPSANSQVISVDTGTVLQGTESEEHDHTEDDPLVVVPLAEEEPEAPAIDNLVLNNAGSVSILSNATATNPDGHASALAYLENGVSQIIAAPREDVSATTTNTGTVRIGSTATATGTTPEGEGSSFTLARATLVGAYHQEGSLEENTDGTATATTTNSGTFEAFSRATASAAGDVVADASTTEALYLRASPPMAAATGSR